MKKDHGRYSGIKKSKKSRAQRNCNRCNKKFSTILLNGRVIFFFCRLCRAKNAGDIKNYLGKVKEGKK